MAKPNTHGSRAVSTGWSSGNLQFRDASGNVIFTVDAANRRLTMASGAGLDISALGLGTGYVPLPLDAWRGISSNDIPAKAIASGGSGVLGKDTTPILERINGATDKALRINWATGDVTEIAQSVVLPPDFTDGTVTVKLRCYKGSNTDTTFVVAVGYWEGVGGSNLGGNTAAITATAAATVSKTVTGTATGGTVVQVNLVPGTHGNDAFYLLGSWLEYTRKLT